MEITLAGGCVCVIDDADAALVDRWRWAAVAELAAKNHAAAEAQYGRTA